MYFVYILQSKIDNSTYIGYTNNLKVRLNQHDSKQNKSTKSKAPYNLIYFEAYRSKADTKYRETNLKRFAQAYNQLKRRLKNSFVNSM